MAAVLSQRIEKFILEHVESVTALEILCVLNRDPIREWSTQVVASELRSHPAAIRASLAALLRAKIVSQGVGPDHYLLATQGSIPVAVVREVCDSFKIYHSRIIELIYSDRKNQQLRSFADAFRFNPRKKGETDS